jgi:hypothetical protein
MRAGHTINGDTTFIRLVSGQLGHEVLCDFPSLVTSSPNDESARHLYDALVGHLKHHTLLLDLCIHFQLAFHPNV